MTRKRRTKAERESPRHAFAPINMLHFQYEAGFLQDCKEIDLNENDIQAIEIAIMTGGTKAAVIPGTGGPRKLRFAPARWKLGKSGAARILFVYFESVASVLMVAAYRKSELDNISDAAKAIYKKLIQQAEAIIKRRGHLC